MDNYLYVMEGNPRIGIKIYRVDKYLTYAISEDYGKTYETVESTDISEQTLEWLSFMYTTRWEPNTTTYTRTSLPRNDADTGITKEEFLEEILRIFGPFVEYNEEESRLYKISYDVNNTKQYKPFDLNLLKRLAANYRYYGSLYEVSRW